MTDDHIQTGDEITVAESGVIFRQGAESDQVYLIMEGSVSIWHELKGRSHRVATLGKGEILGEISAIEERPHSATAIAASDCLLYAIPVSAFRRSFADPLVRHVVHTLAARLRSTLPNTEENRKPAPANARKAGGGSVEHTPFEPGDAPPRATHPDAELTLAPGSALTAQHMPDSLEIDHLPFTVGNRANGDVQGLSTNALLLPLPGHSELAPQHFQIVRRDGLYCLRDISGKQGTMLEGRRLSRFSEHAVHRLHFGENTITAGGADSPIRFTLTLTEPGLKQS
ncbi:cyclic nucleotide-binding domain-containing protein [Yunchengibacter salinarum]|uniref:cyclic nucleotide-binding domain-containing protein n=1 Tax=Yunchengibacter salinarum TaxID=3133399 RepID=UPI0035B60DC0